MKKNLCAVASAAAVLLLAGCASQPDSIVSQSASTLPYEDYNCKQIGREMVRVNDRVITLYDRLEKMADDDAGAMAVGLIVFWPALFLLEGGDGPEADEYARLRGEMDALQKVGIQKSCSDIPEFRDPIQLAMARKAREKAEAEKEATADLY